jgi:hypothetical protein
VDLNFIDRDYFEYVAEHEFTSPIEVLEAAAALGAEDCSFEWPGEVYEFCVDDESREWILKHYDGNRRVSPANASQGRSTSARLG